MRSIDRPGLGSALQPAVNSRDFEDAVTEHVGVLTAVAGRLVGTDHAADIVQEALVRAWRRWETFDPTRGTLRTWLAAIVVDRARVHRRKFNPDVAMSDVPAQPLIETDHLQRLQVEKAVSSLPRRQREVIVLYYLADLSVEDTARALGIKAGSVKAHLAAARARLTTELQERAP